MLVFKFRFISRSRRACLNSLPLRLTVKRIALWFAAIWKNVGTTEARKKKLKQVRLFLFANR